MCGFEWICESRYSCNMLRDFPSYAYVMPLRFLCDAYVMPCKPCRRWNLGRSLREGLGFNLLLTPYSCHPICCLYCRILNNSVACFLRFGRSHFDRRYSSSSAGVPCCPAVHCGANVRYLVVHRKIQHWG